MASRRAILGLIVALVALAALPGALASRPASEDFQANVTHVGTEGGPGYSASDQVDVAIPSGTDRIRIEAEWAKGTGPMTVQVYDQDCQGVCSRDEVAVANGSSPLAFSTPAPNSTRLWLHVHDDGGPGVQRQVVGTVTFLDDGGDDGDGEAEPQEVPSSSATPSPADDGPTASTIVAGGLALLAGLVAAWRRWTGGLGVGLASLYHRLTDAEDLLEHPVRQRLYETVADEPGIHFEELSRRLDMGRGHLDHHLAKLTRADLLEEKRAGGYRAYFRPGQVPRRLQVPLVLLKAEGARQLLAAADGEAGIRELARRTGLAPSTVSHHVARLDEVGLVRVRDAGRSRAVEATEQAQRALEIAADGRVFDGSG